MHAPADRLDVLVHVPYEGPAALADRAAARGMDVRIHRMYAAEPVPTVGAVSRLAVMGGPMGATDDTACRWLPGVRALLADAVATGVPVLGVCLGAQLLAAACGAAVYPGPAPEIGPGRVRLTGAAATDPVFGAVGSDELDVFHWHGDTFDLPDGATLLASSDRYVHQAFRIGRAWGCQFHVELRAGDAATVTAHLDGTGTATPEALAVIEPAGTQMIDAFLDVTGGPSSDPTPPG